MENPFERSEFETIPIKNPTKEDFTGRFNGEEYKVAPGEEKSYPQNVAYHLAKQLSDKIIGKEVEKLKKKATDNPYRPEIAQLVAYDNPKRRIALYDILGKDDEVKAAIASFPWRGFIGEKKEYVEYVTKQELKVSQ